MIYMTMLIHTSPDCAVRMTQRLQSLHALSVAALKAAQDGHKLDTAKYRDVGGMIRYAGCLLCGKQFRHRCPGVVLGWYRKHDCTKDVSNG